jgi:circadian clock protein KaiC
MSIEAELAIERMPTGVAGLDVILRGGFLRGGIYIFQGAPGAGKTIFANQIAFHHVSAGGRVVYVTLLSESHARMLQHLQSLKFFKPEVIPKSLSYVSAFRALEDSGLSEVVSLLRREVKGQQATLLILDGLVAAQESAATDREFKKFIHEIQSHAAASGCTTLLLTSGRHAQVQAEHTMVDGLIDLEDQLFSQRTERALRVTKFRGSDFLAGRHPFRISDAGIVLSPRIEAAFAQASRPERQALDRLSSGIPSLDAMLGGGVTDTSSSVVLGASGTGKTAIGLAFASQATVQQKALYLSFFESPQRLSDRAASLGLPIEKLVDSGVLHILWEPQGERIIDELAYLILDTVQTQGIRRLVIDGLNAFTAACVYPGRISRFYSCLTNELRARGVTSLHTSELPEIVGGTLRMAIDGISAMTDNLIVLRYIEHDARLSRVMSVLKVRDRAFDHDLREFTIGAEGVVIGEGIEGLEGMLGGATHELRRRASPPNPTKPKT